MIKEFILLFTVAVLSAIAFTALAAWAIDDEFRQQDEANKQAMERRQ